jgi:hypothetical protein
MKTTLRQIAVTDYAPIIHVVNDWWGGRPVAGMLQRLFFEHFQPTSSVIEYVSSATCSGRESGSFCRLGMVPRRRGGGAPAAAYHACTGRELTCT